VEYKTIKIGKHSLKQFDEDEYSFENPKEELEFSFVITEPDEMAVIIFDSLLSHDGGANSSLGVFFVSNNLKEAVSEAMLVTKENVSSIIMWQ
jgi:hypothetical protein